MSNNDGLYIGLFPINNTSEIIEYIKLNESLIKNEKEDFLNIFENYFNEFKYIDNDTIKSEITITNNNNNNNNIEYIKIEEIIGLQNIYNSLNKYTNYSKMSPSRINFFINDRKGYYGKRKNRIDTRKLDNNNNKHDKDDNYAIILFSNNNNNINYLYTTANIKKNKFIKDISNFKGSNDFKTLNIKNTTGGKRNKTKKKYNHRLNKKINTKNYKKSKKYRH